jgi:hypothetical protein
MLCHCEHWKVAAKSSSFLSTLPYFTRNAVVFAASCPWDAASLMALEGIGGLVCTCHLRLHRLCLLRAINNTDNTTEIGKYF